MACPVVEGEERRGILGATAALAAASVLPARAQERSIVFNDSGGASLEAANKAFGIPLKTETGVDAARNKTSGR